MSILHKAVYKLNTIPVKVPHYFFIETEKKIKKFIQRINNKNKKK